MGLPSSDPPCSSTILISPINSKMEVMVIYLALVRFVPFILSSLSSNAFCEET